MPVIDDDFTRHDINGTGYGFSGARLDRLGSSEYTLVAIAADVSGSVNAFKAEIERCIQAVVRACRQAPRADNLMLRLSTFDDRIDEVHGFRPLMECPPADYLGALTIGGCTALYDGSHNAVLALARYGGDLTDHGFSANAVVFVITDGHDNRSSLAATAVARAITDARTGERVESLLAVLVGVDAGPHDATLAAYAREAGFDHYLPLADADPATLAGLADFVSRHIDLQSRALGSGVAAAMSLGF